MSNACEWHPADQGTTVVTAEPPRINQRFSTGELPVEAGRYRLVWAGASGAAATGKVPGATAAGTVPAGTAITLASYTDRPELGEMVPLLAQQLEAAGFKVTQDVREYNQIESEALAGKFHAVLVSRSYAMSGLHDETVDAAISKAAAAEPGDERRKAIMAAEQAILVTGAAIPLAHERVIQGEAAGVTGAERDPNERALITPATTVKK